jgi:hypothetical protein
VRIGFVLGFENRGLFLCRGFLCRDRKVRCGGFWKVEKRQTFRAVCEVERRLRHLRKDRGGTHKDIVGVRKRRKLLDSRSDFGGLGPREGPSGRARRVGRYVCNEGLDKIEHGGPLDHQRSEEPAQAIIVDRRRMRRGSRETREERAGRSAPVYDVAVKSTSL